MLLIDVPFYLKHIRKLLFNAILKIEKPENNRDRQVKGKIVGKNSVNLSL